MKYQFPHIQHLDDVRQAIRGRKEFIVAERDWGYVVNYHVCLVDTFGDGKSLTDQLRRECRGIKFGLDGKIIARPYHKFFNFNERNETRIERVPFDEDFIILEKLDGSMVHPIFVAGGPLDVNAAELIWCTKMGPTDVAFPVEKFVSKNQHYARYAAHVMASGWTPIFEWCSRVQRIVIDYPEDRLVLTAMRKNVTGEYLPYDQLKIAETHGIEIIKQWPGTFTGATEFAEEIQVRENEEGYVTRWSTGHMIKWKNMWYLQLHKAKELMQNEKDVWAIVLDGKVDDAKAFQEKEDQDRLDAFQRDLLEAIDQTVDRLKWEVIAWVDNKGDGKKKFAVDFVNGPNSTFTDKEKGLLFRIFDGKDPREVVYDNIRQSLGTFTKLETVRHLANGIEWKEY